MYRKDYFLNETQRLAQIIAKLMGLKNTAGQEQQVKQVYHNALVDEYGLEPAQIQALNPDEFEAWLNSANFSAAKIDTLARLLYQDIEPLQPTEGTLIQLKKVLLLLDRLEQQHHLQLFENIAKRQLIEKYIQQHHA